MQEAGVASPRKREGLLRGSRRIDRRASPANGGRRRRPRVALDATGQHVAGLGAKMTRYGKTLLIPVGSYNGIAVDVLPQLCFRRNGLNRSLGLVLSLAFSAA